MPISINLPAAQTAYLHAAKHADCAVFGLLIGSKDGSLEQAVPVCHLNVGCSPIVEAACVVVESMCKSDGLRIVGCYYAPMGIAEVVDFKEQKHRVLQSLAAAVLPAQGFTVCLVFSNADSGRALSLSDCHLPFQAWSLEAGCSASHWKQADNLVCNFAPEKLRDSLILSLKSAEGMLAVVDMDDHMEQSGCAWPVISK